MVKPKIGLSRFGETWSTLRYFFGLQIFFTAMITSFNFGGEIIFGLLVAVSAILIPLTGNRNAPLFLLYFICVLFVVGQRTFYIGQYIRIVPSEALLWVLGFMCLFLKSQYPSKTFLVPISIFLLCLVSALAIFRSANSNLAISYAKMMWMSIPAFFATGKLIQRINHIQSIVTILAIGCLFLSFLALSEYYQLGFTRFFSGYLKAGFIEAQEQEFKRLGASFWGGPMLASFLALCLPLTLAQWFVSKTALQKIIIGLSISVSILSIYLSGHRGIWAPVLFSMAIFFYLKGIRGIFILILLVAVALPLVPSSAIVRFKGIYGETRDTSSEVREQRARFACDLIKKEPLLGNGWGASGLVHSDFLQLGADASVLATLAFLWIFFRTFLRLLYLKPKEKIFREYHSGFAGFLVVSFLILMVETWFNLPEQYTPFWVLFALAWRYPQIVLNERKVALSNAQNEMKIEVK